ncbi:MAG: ATP-grasp domain-containing protein [Desulfobacteraceae bacterium]|nr:ATP-grasp domain-containing protein [Desulfobacteraceae bacterium]MCF8112078.1 ATP-grasp domain-containing protein [Desulfobacteraceae bacterium]
MTNVLITDGENRSSLAVVRSLGRKGCRVVVTANRARSLASCSRYCSRGIRVPDPVWSGVAYGAAIKDVVDQEKIDAVFPMTEVSIYLINKIREQFPDAVRLACAGADKMAAVSNKSGLFQLAEKLNVPVPKTLYLSGAEDLPARVREIDQYPVVVKPAFSKIPQGNGFLSGGVEYAASRDELEQLYATSDVLQHPSLIQEKIQGPGTGLFTLFDRDRHLALFSHRRIREKPPSGGVSVISESVPLDAEMVDASRRLLAAVEWRGVAMVEFKRDLRDGRAKLMEINGRFWGSLQLAIVCGVDFPALYLDLVQGEKPVDVVKEYPAGHKLKWFFGTLDHLLIRLKNHHHALNLPPGTPPVWRAVRDFLKIREKNTFFDVIDRKDMGPFLCETADYFKRN